MRYNFQNSVYMSASGVNGMYLGSVRFFRHLILTVLLLLLLLPLIGAGILSVKYVETQDKLEQAVAAMDSYSEKQDELKEEFAMLSSAVRSQISLLQPQINVAIHNQMSDFRDQLSGIISDQDQVQQDLYSLMKEYKQEHSGKFDAGSVK